MARVLLILFLVTLGTVVDHTEGFLGLPPIRDTGRLARAFTGFTSTDNLGTPTDLKYAFILVRHAMVVPVDKSFPSDGHYKRKWKKDRFTTHGKRLMTKLGRSLATRYTKFIDTFRSDSIHVTTLDTTYGYNNAVELLRGLLPTKTKPAIIKSGVDKYHLLKNPNGCEGYARMRSDKVYDKEQCDKEETDLITYLRKSIGPFNKDKSEWYIESRKQVYNLWEILDFEKKSKQEYPRWYEEQTHTTMHKIVQLFLHNCIFGKSGMSQYVAGRMFRKMLSVRNSDTTKLHVHVTNDFTYAAFKSILLESDVEIPEYGETLMVEVDTNDYVRVHTYKPFQEDNNVQFNLKFFKTQETRFYGILILYLRVQHSIDEGLDDKEWERRCKEWQTPIRGAHDNCDTHGLGSRPSFSHTRETLSNGHEQTIGFTGDVKTRSRDLTPTDGQASQLSPEIPQRFFESGEKPSPSTFPLSSRVDQASSLSSKTLSSSKRNREELDSPSHHKDATPSNSETGHFSPNIHRSFIEAETPIATTLTRPTSFRPYSPLPSETLSSSTQNQQGLDSPSLVREESIGDPIPSSPRRDIRHTSTRIEAEEISSSPLTSPSRLLPSTSSPASNPSPPITTRFQELKTPLRPP